MKILDYTGAHSWVENTKHDAFWDGWDIVVWRRNPNGATNRKGMFRKGRWGIADRYSVKSDGTWRIPGKYAN